MNAGTLRKSLYRLAWDTRCRNVDVARILRPSINSGTTVLDAGCGEYGLSAFVAAKSVVGVDILPTDAKVDGFAFVHGSILSLPFADRSFSIAAAVDVLEHLPEALRPDAIKQLVRVADETIILTFPCGGDARKIDENFNRKLMKSNQSIPSWLSEHLEHNYPEADDVAAAIENEVQNLGRKVRISIHYSENLAVAKYLRWSAAHSRYLYLIGNLATGLLLPFLPKVKRDNAYRAIVLAKFVEA